jgi:hypothetical protein
VIALATVLLAALSGCTVAGHAVPLANTAAGVVVTAPGITTHTHDLGPGRAPAPDLRFLSDLYDLRPSGRLSSPAIVTLRLPRPVPAGDVVVIATRETSTDPWDYLPATLTTNRASVTFTTTHFSIFGVLAYDLAETITVFKRDFIDGIDGGATQTVDKPACDNEQAARGDGYAITSDTTDTVYWCLGENAAAQHILKVTDHRRYPLLVAHPGMHALNNAYDWGQWSSLSRLDAGSAAIIAPGGTAVFNADLAPGGSEGIRTQIDALGQSLYALQTGVRALVDILTRFGVGSGITAVEIADKILTVQSCGSSMGKGSSDVIAGCFDAKTILDVFGAKGR